MAPLFSFATSNRDNDGPPSANRTSPKDLCTRNRWWSSVFSRSASSKGDRESTTAIRSIAVATSQARSKPASSCPSPVPSSGRRPAQGAARRRGMSSDGIVPSWWAQAVLLPHEERAPRPRLEGNKSAIGQGDGGRYSSISSSSSSRRSEEQRICWWAPPELPLPSIAEVLKLPPPPPPPPCPGAADTSPLQAPQAPNPPPRLVCVDSEKAMTTMTTTTEDKPTSEERRDHDHHVTEPRKKRTNYKNENRAVEVAAAAAAAAARLDLTARALPLFNSDRAGVFYPQPPLENEEQEEEEEEAGGTEAGEDESPAESDCKGISYMMACSFWPGEPASSRSKRRSFR